MYKITIEEFPKGDMVTPERIIARGFLFRNKPCELTIITGKYDHRRYWEWKTDGVVIEAPLMDEPWQLLFFALKSVMRGIKK